MNKYHSAVSEMIQFELSLRYSTVFTIEEQKDESYKVSGDNGYHGFNDIYIKVTTLDSERPMYSEFKIRVGEDDWTHFNIYSDDVRELYTYLTWDIS